MEITVTDLSGMGSCICGPMMHFPLQLEDICNEIIVVGTQGQYLLAPNRTYLACSTGLTRYIEIAVYRN